MNNSPLKAARLTIELDTQEAAARLDELEEKLDELTEGSNKQEGEVTRNEKRTTALGRERQDRQLGGQRPSIDNTGPGKFGIRNIPAILTAADMAGVVGGLVPIEGGAVGAVARKMVELEQQYGPLATGIVEGTLKQFGVPEAIAKLSVKAVDKTHKIIGDIDKRLKAITPTFESVIEMAKAQIMASGHINADQLAKFTQTSYEWEFVNQRKTQDIRDKTLRIIGEEAPNVVKELFSRATQGKLVP